METMTRITTRWQTICCRGYQGSVSRNENRAAHGAVCLCQARRTRDGRLVGRLVNTNGRHEEVGEPFPLDADRLAGWESFARQAGQR